MRGARAEAAEDVVVIGGGPAGATAATLLASWGRRVTLLVRVAPQPQLAESLPPSCAKLLERVGARRVMDEVGFVRSTGNTVWWGGTGPRVERFGSGAYGYQVPRHAFDRLLTRRAKASGATVRGPARALDVVRVEDGETPLRDVHVEGTGPGVTRTRWVLDCTGRAGLVARRGWRRAEAGARTLAIVATWSRRRGWGLPDETHTLVESYEGGWAWSVPVSRSRRYVTVMVDPTLTPVRGRAELARTYDAELARVPHLHDLVRGARRSDEPWARDASPYAAERVGEEGLLLVGDAASFVDPLSSYGVKKAMASAWLAAVVVNTCLSRPGLVGPALELYERREREMYDALQRRLAELARDAAAVHASGFWQERDAVAEADSDGEGDVAALRADPEVLAAFEELKRRPAVQLRATTVVSRVPKAVVRGDTVVLEDHLVVPAFRDGVRYLRSVDLVALSDLAPAYDEVPSLYDAYNRAAPPVPLPDFLGALSVLVGKRALALT